MQYCDNQVSLTLQLLFVPACVVSESQWQEMQCISRKCDLLTVESVFLRLNDSKLIYQEGMIFVRVMSLKGKITLNLVRYSSLAQ